MSGPIVVDIIEHELTKLYVGHKTLTGVTNRHITNRIYEVCSKLNIALEKEIQIDFNYERRHITFQLNISHRNDTHNIYYLDIDVSLGYV